MNAITNIIALMFVSLRAIRGFKCNKINIASIDKIIYYIMTSSSKIMFVRNSAIMCAIFFLHVKLCPVDSVYNLTHD